MKENIIEERRNKNIFDCMALIINYLKNMRVEGLDRDYTGILI